VAQTVNLDAVRRLPAALVQLRHRRPSVALLVDRAVADHGDQVVLAMLVQQEPRQQAPRVAQMATLGARRPLPAA